MSRYILKRVLIGILSVLVLATIAFFMIHAVPGGPFQLEAGVSQAAIDNMIARYGIDKPVFEQYLLYMKNLLHGDLGESLKYSGVTVNELIMRGLDRTVRLAILATLAATTVGILLGITASLKPRGLADNLCVAVSTIGICIPNYVLCVLLMFVFGIRLKLLPITGLDTWKHYILPVVALSMNPIANIAKLTRSGMIEALNQDYMITARAKGLPTWKVVLIHALKNAMMPVVTYLGPMIAHMITGSFVIEDLFTVAGVGKMFTNSISNRDYTALTGMVTFFGILIIVIGIIVDLVYAGLDPRVRLEK